MRTPPPISYMTFGALLKALRKQAGLSQAALGRAVNYTREFISLLEHGRRDPDPTVVASLFVPALHLVDAPESACRLIELAAQARGKQPADFGITISHQRTQTASVHDVSPQAIPHEDAVPAQASHLQSILQWYVQVDPEAALELANVMGTYWRANGHFSQARAWLRTILAHSTSSRVSRGQALLHAAEFARHQGDHSEALTLFEQSQRVFQDHGDIKGQCAALIERGWALFDTNHRRDEAIDVFEQCVLLSRQHRHLEGLADALGALAHVRMSEASEQNRFGDIQILLDEALRCARAVGNARKIGFVLNQWAVLQLQQGRPIAAQSLFDQAIHAFQDADDQYALAWTYDGLGECYFDQGNRAAARRYHELALSTFRASGAREGAITNLHHLARIDAYEGQHASSIARFIECLQLCETHGHPQMRARCIAGLAHIALNTQREAQGVQLLAAANRIISQLPPFLYAAQRAEYLAFAAQARALLGDVVFELAWSHGATLSDGEVTAMAYTLV